MLITLQELRPDAFDAAQLIKELDAHLAEYPYPSESRHAFSIDRLVQENVAFFVSYNKGQAAGCGGIKLFGCEYGEVKRMYVRPQYRGLGLAKAMLNHLAHYVLERQVMILRLETGIYQPEAIRLYESCGFRRRPPFGEYREDPMSVYFEKVLSRP